MKSLVRSLVQRALATLGLEVRRRQSHFVEPFADQATLLRATGQPVQTIFDIGAHVGAATTQYRRLFPDATIYAFEPTEAPFRQLEALARSDSRVLPVNAAVAEQPGQATFHLNAFDETNSLLPADARCGDVKPTGTTTVKVITLDGFVAERGLTTIDLLKLDIQGSELAALRGARGLLERRAIRLIYCEVLFAPMYAGQSHYHDIAAYLHSFGYYPYGLYHLIRGPAGRLAWADAIFLPGEP